MASRDADLQIARRRALGGPERFDRGKLGRVTFVMHQDQMVLLHGFVKKTQKTPLLDIRIATRRKKDFLK